MRNTFRIALILFFPLILAGCFNIIHYIDVGKDGKVQVRWRMSVSSALTEMGQMQGGDDSASLDEDLKNAEQQIKASLKGVAEQVQVKKFENDQSQGIDVSLSVKNLDVMKSKAMPRDEMPIVPIYDAGKKQLVFRFTPDNTQKLQGPGAGPGNMNAEDDMSSEAEEDSEATDEGLEGGADGAEADPMQGMEQLGEKLGQLFASAATYDIFVGSGFKVQEAYLRDMSGAKLGTIEVIALGDQNLVRFPLLGMISQDKNQKGFEVVVQLR